MSTIKDVAKLAGVALSTASYALNDSSKISQSTKNKVLAAAKSLNYQKNGFASDLKKSRTGTIALILSDLSGPYFSELIQGVQDTARSHNYDLIACSSIGGSESTAVKFLTEKRVDGAIVLANDISDEIAVEAANSSFPLIVLDRSIQDRNIFQVEVDNTQGAYKAVEYLIKNEHKHIAYVGGPTDSHDNQLRYIGYRNALKAHNLSTELKWKINSNFTRGGGYQSTKLLIAQKNLPEAIFFGNDEMAIGGIQALKDHAIKVPEDISVIGFDNIQLAEHVTPALTTIKQPKYEVGALSAHLIFQFLSNEDIEHYYKLSTELIIRESVTKRQVPTGS